MFRQVHRRRRLCVSTLIVFSDVFSRFSHISPKRNNNCLPCNLTTFKIEMIFEKKTFWNFPCVFAIDGLTLARLLIAMRMKMFGCVY